MVRKHRREIVASLLLCLAVAMLPALSTMGWDSEDARTADVDVMLGQMVMVGFRGLGEEPLSPAMRVLLDDIGSGKIGGVILFEPDYLTRSIRNIRSLEQTRNLTRLLQENASIPLFVAVDQEGGRVRRFTSAHGFPDTPSAREMGSRPEAETRERAAELGTSLADAGVNLDFAPVVDLDVNPDSPAIGAHGRAFSADPVVATRQARAFAEGLWSRRILYCYKHFPGHGGAAGDTHAGFVDIDKTWSRDELIPYRELLRGDPPCMVMVGHLSLGRFDAVHPASLSREVVTGLLRGELAWDGVVVTDDLQMGAIREHYGDAEAIALAVNAGVDVILVGNNLVHDPELGRKIHAILRALLDDGTISRERVEQSYARIIALRKRLRSGK